MNVAVVAGPGTGKTLTLLRKALYVVESKEAKANQVRIVNFTNAGVFDIRRKLQTDKQYSRLTPSSVSTFHSLALRQLLKVSAPSIPKPIVVLDEWEEKTFIDQFVKCKCLYATFAKRRNFARTTTLVGA